MRNRTAVGITLLLALLLAGASTAWAAEITSVSATPSSLTIQQNSTGTFTAQIDSVSGRVPSATPGAKTITYCSDWTIHNDGSISCNSTATLPLEPGRNYTQDPLLAAIAGTVTVNVDPGTPCTPPNNVYTITETFTANAGSGIDFGGGVLVATRTVTVTVTCQTSTYGGCSHGYFKNHHSSWVGYVGTTTLGSLFTIPNDTAYSGLSSATFDQALAFSGGPGLADKARLLMVQAVAAVLNAANSEVSYPLTVSGVVGEVNTALASLNQDTIEEEKDRLDEFNNLGCPLSDPNDSQEQ